MTGSGITGASITSHLLVLVHDVSGALCRPLVLEEFGTISSLMDEEERKVVFSVVFDKLIEARRTGKPFMGAMFWNAALWGECT